MITASDKIAAGLEDAIAYVGGDTSCGRESTIDMRAIRAAAGKAQARFAANSSPAFAAIRQQPTRNVGTGGWKKAGARSASLYF